MLPERIVFIYESEPGKQAHLVGLLGGEFYPIAYSCAENFRTAVIDAGIRPDLMLLSMDEAGKRIAQSMCHDPILAKIPIAFVVDPMKVAPHKRDQIVKRFAAIGSVNEPAKGGPDIVQQLEKLLRPEAAPEPEEPAWIKQSRTWFEKLAAELIPA
jgi:hypothetical protein